VTIDDSAYLRNRPASAWRRVCERFTHAVERTRSGQADGVRLLRHVKRHLAQVSLANLPIVQFTSGWIARTC